jgi:hypothetical protein
VRRYRLRTFLRGHSPSWLVNLGAFPKGKKDCGRHERYYAYENFQGSRIGECYHCEGPTAKAVLDR